MKQVMVTMLALCLLAFVGRLPAQEKGERGETTKPVSFKAEVLPILQKHCLPCHAEAEANVSELSLDNYKLLTAGGRKGPAFVPGKSGKSILMQKMGEKPPFGDRMPLNSRKKVREGKAKWLSDEEMRTIATWIDQGGKDN